MDAEFEHYNVQVQPPLLSLEKAHAINSIISILRFSLCVRVCVCACVRVCVCAMEVGNSGVELDCDA